MSTAPQASSSSDPKAAPVKPKSDRGLIIRTYPKIIFFFPTMVVALICWIGMLLIGNDTGRPSREAAAAAAEQPSGGRMQDFRSPQNLMGVLFLGTLTLNLLVLSFDFPRFTVVAGGLLLTTILFFLLWLLNYMNVFHFLGILVQWVYAVADAQFYFWFAFAILVNFAIVLGTRWLDYWEFLPNEILHHHGPWSDLERFPTQNLKFDKEIPDIFEHAIFHAGRFVLHVSGSQKAIVLESVLWMEKKEEALKNLLSRMEVRITTDQEVGDTNG